MASYVVWDWNGTLLDDVDLCIQVMNGMLKKRGLPLLPGREAYRKIFTFPVEDYYRALGFDFDREPFPRLAAEYIEAYNSRAVGCPLRQGAGEALEALGARGAVQIIASASHRQALEEQVGHFGIGGYFQALLGVEDSFGRGKAGLARAYLERVGAPLEQVLFVGDTLHDAQVARELGCRCVLLPDGHQDRARLEQAGVPVVSLHTLVEGWRAN